MPLRKYSISAFQTPKMTHNDDKMIAEIAKLTHPASGSLSRYCIDDIMLEACCRLDNGRLRRDRERRNQPNSGFFSRLPLELLHMVFDNLHIQGLTTLRRTNSDVRRQISDYIPYKDIHDQAPSLLRACLATGVADWIHANPLRRALNSSDCALCGDFGSYISILSCQRLCLICASTNDLAMPVRLSPLGHAKGYRLHESQIRDVPRIRVIPGTYGPAETPAKAESVLADRAALLQIREEFQARLPQTSMQAGGRPGQELGRFAKIGDRFAHLLLIPWKDSAEGRLQSGLSCRSCVPGMVKWGSDYRYVQPRSVTHQHRLYTVKAFVKHLEECEGSRNALKLLHEDVDRVEGRPST